MLIGREMARNINYLLRRAADELDVHASGGAIAERIAAPYVAVFGVPEIGAQIRISEVVKAVRPDARNILDVGCGAGLLLGALSRARPSARLTGVEIDKDAGAVARDLHPRSAIHIGDFMALAPTLGTFDCVCNIDVLEHIEDADLQAFVHACFSVLNPGGSLVIHVPAVNQRRHFQRFMKWQHHDHEREGFTGADLFDLLTRVGFTDIKMSGTFGFWGSLAWELNMLAAGSFMQALTYPPALLIGKLDRLARSRRYNGWLIEAKRPSR